MKLGKIVRLMSIAASLPALALLTSTVWAQSGQTTTQFGPVVGEATGIKSITTQGGPVGPSPSARRSHDRDYRFQQEDVNLDPNAGNVRVMRTDQKQQMNDFVSATFPLHNVDPREIRNVMRTITGLEGGRAEENVEGHFLQVIAPAWQIPYLEEAVEMLDHKWVREYDTGSSDIYYKAKNRNAADIDTIASNYGSENGFSAVDATNNAVNRIDEPYRIDNYMVGVKAVDIPANQVMLEVKVYEIASSDDLKLGLDYINWKNGPGRSLFSFIYTGATSNSHADTLTSVFDPFTNAAAGVIGAGLEDKTFKTGFNQFYRSFNYLLTSNFLDFLQVRGQARVLRDQSITVKSANPAFIAADDQIVAPVSTGGNFDRSAITAVRFHNPNGEDSATFIDDVKTPRVVGVQSVSIPDSDRRLNNRPTGSTGVFLNAVPFVGLVSMELVVDIEVADLNGLAPNGEPIINSRTLTSTVRLLDGEPYVIGGIKRTHVVKETAKAPVLGDIPVIGYLAGGETQVKRSDEVLIVVTPHFYLAAQTNCSAPAAVRELAKVINDERGVGLPHNHYGYDQWLLDPTVKGSDFVGGEERDPIADHVSADKRHAGGGSSTKSSAAPAPEKKMEAKPAPVAEKKPTAAAAPAPVKK